ncbi:MAG TPA: hypothetical protein VF212_10950 [Longimicrobiales bacterium]
MNEDRFESLLRDAAREYNRPPEPPRDAMWARIEQARRHRRPPRLGPIVRPWHWGLGMAAMLAVGIGIGRLTPGAAAGDAGAGPIAAAPATTAGKASGAGLPYRLAATQHLSRTEAFLTSYQSGTLADRNIGEVSAWARELLTGTRLLLDSPAAQDPRLELLLRDLELVLAQIAHLPAAGNTAEEAEIIDDALERRDTLSRLRSAVPAGAAGVTGI